MEKLLVGLIGAGRIAHVHAEAYATISSARLVAVADPDEGRRRAIAERFGLEAYADHRELLRRSDIEAVDICTPTLTHEEITIDALRAGKHVSCQKPFSLSIEACDRMITAARDSGKVLIVPYMNRHAPLSLKAKELIESGAIGTPVNAHYHMLCPASVALTRWFREEDKSGGIVVDTLTHGVDLFNWYFGLPSEIGGFITSSGGVGTEDLMAKDDNAVLMAHYPSGVVATFRVSWCAPANYPMVLTDIIGSKGALRLEAPSGAISYFRLTHFTGDEQRVWESSGRGHVEKTEYFVSVARGDRPLTTSTPEDAREALRVTLAGWRSGRECSIMRL